MRRAAFTWGCACALFSSGLARADEPPFTANRDHPSVALFAGYGLPLDAFPGDLRSSGVGFGTRAGVTLGFGGYVGGTFVKHLGTRRSGTRDADVGGYAAAAHETYAGAEIGWDFRPFRFLFRPFLGAGLHVRLERTSLGSASISDDQAAFYLAPGSLAAIRFGDIFAGVDVRVPMVLVAPSNTWSPAGMLVFGTDLGTR